MEKANRIAKEGTLSKKLEGKVVVVTGAGKGMARTICVRLAAEGARIVGCDIDEEGAEETVKTVRDAGGEMESLYPLDLRDEESTHHLMEFAAERFGGIDCLYNNAMAMKLGSIESMSLDDWRETLDGTLTIHFLATKHAVPQIRSRGGGSIVFVGSMAGLHLGAGYAGNFGWLFSYSCAKAAILRMSSALATDLAEDNIRVNSILPGNVETPATIEVYGQPGTELRRISQGGKLIDRLGLPDDVAKAALFLLSDDSEWVTGSQLLVDGGFVVSGGAGRASQSDRELLDSVIESWIGEQDLWETTGDRRSRL
jgi:meso-butanediol dehydrogenase/(S,S)-butanediol dehydrogenase/diacetyl reductase